MEYLIGNFIGLTNIIIGFPLDTLKVNYQKNNKMPKLNMNLYNGVRYPLYSSLILNTCVFGNYNRINNYTNNKFLGGCILGGVSSIFINPFEVKKITSQVNFNNKNIKYYSGLKYTFIRESLGYGIFFSIYDDLNKTNSTFLAGGISGMISWLFTYPIDTIRTRKLLNRNIKVKNLYHGITFCLCRSFLLDGITFTIFDKTNKLFNKK